MAYPGKQSVIIYIQDDTKIMTNHTTFIRYFNMIISQGTGQIQNMNNNEKPVGDSKKLQNSKWGKYRLTIKKMQHIIALSSEPPHVPKDHERGSEQINNKSKMPTEGFRGLKRIAKGVSTIQKLDLSLDSNPIVVSEKIKVLRNCKKNWSTLQIKYMNT